MLSVEVNANFVEFDGSELNFCFVRDITERKRVQAQATAVLNSLTAHIAVVDGHGIVLAVNKPWLRFARENDASDRRDVLPGVNYLDVVQRAVAAGDEFATEALAGIRRVLHGGEDRFELEYPCHSPTEHRWFLMIATPLFGTEGAVLAHEDITARKLAEDALHEADARLRLSVAASNIGLWDWNIAAGEIYFSREWKGQLGYADDELPNRFGEWESRVHPDDFAAVQSKLQRFLQDPAGSYATEFRLRHRDGSYRWIYTQAQLFHDGAGKPLRMLGCHVDVTERKQAEESLRESEDRYRKIFEEGPLGIAMGSLSDGRLLRANRAACEMLGYSEDELKRLTFEDVTHPEHRAADREAVALLREGRISSSSAEKRYVKKNGEVIWAARALTKILGADGKTFYALAMIQDITNRKLAEAALRERDERLRAAMAASGTGTFRWDLRTNDVNCDEALDRLLGLSRKDTIRSLAGFSAVVHADDRQGVIEQLRGCAEDGADFEMEYRVRWPNGTDHWLDARGKTTSDIAGKPLYMTGACVDITDRKRDEAALHDLARRLLRAEDAERRRIAKELHDSTAQDLVAVMMNLGTLRDTLTSPDLKRVQMLDDIIALVENSANDIRTLSYVLHPPRLEEMGLPGALTEYAAGLGRRADIRIRVDAAKDFGRLPEELELVLFRVAQESLVNAVRHSHSDAATIRLARTDWRAMIEIEDFGCGMPPDDAAQPGAYGVGIIGMRERVQHLGGELEVESDAGGTIVRAMLPLKRERP